LGRETGETQQMSSPNFNPVPSYLHQEWSPVQNEIEERIRQMMKAYKLMDWNDCYHVVMAADPSLAGKVWDAARVELDRRVKELQGQHDYSPATGGLTRPGAGRPLGYDQALTVVMNNDSGFARYYQAARTAQFGAPQLTTANQVEAEIIPLVKAKIAASDVNTSFGEALRLVLSERPDLARRHKDALR
jgi:hypothetical protein